MQNSLQNIPDFIPAHEALRLGAMAIVPNPKLGLHFYAPPETGHTPHGCALGGMLYAAGVRESVSHDSVAGRAIAMWPILGEACDIPERAAGRMVGSWHHHTVAHAIECLAFAGESYTQIADWLEPIEAHHRERAIAAAPGRDKLRLIGEQWLHRRTARTAHGLPARSYEAAATYGSTNQRING